MPPENKIVKLNLEKRAIALRKDKSIREIARILSSESGHTISKSVVQTYFNRQDAYKSQVLETAGCLGAKVIEAEIDTIAKRQEVIEGLLNLAKNAHNEHARVQAYKAANDALDSLDSRLGKLSPAKNTQNNFFVNAPGAEPAKLRDRMKVYDAIFEEADES